MYYSIVILTILYYLRVADLMGITSPYPRENIIAGNYILADMSDAVMHKAKSYVDNWEETKRNHIGCLFWGPVGTGKSYIAGCIANELLKQEVTVKMTNFNTIIDDIFPLVDKTEYINALASYQLLIIDDLGVERNSEYALGIIFSIIDRRIRSGRPLIITTNLPLKEIKSETMLDKRRIKKLRRIAEDNLGTVAVYCGNRFLIIRPKFEEFILNSSEI